MKTILIYNNNTGIVEEMRQIFAEEGYRLQVVTTPESLQEYVVEGKDRLLIMDVELMREPGPIQSFYTGIDVLHKIREISNLPIIVLSANGSEQAKIAVLNAGADDYVTCPYSPSELLARVKSQIRRFTQLSNTNKAVAGIYQVGELVIDDICKKVQVSGREVRLTPLEYKILRLLVKAEGRVFSIEQIYESIWNMEAIGADNTIAVHIRHIREKIEPNPKEPRYLKVVWGRGYRVG